MVNIRKKKTPLWDWKSTLESVGTLSPNMIAILAAIQKARKPLQLAVRQGDLGPGDSTKLDVGSCLIVGLTTFCCFPPSGPTRTSRASSTAATRRAWFITKGSAQTIGSVPCTPSSWCASAGTEIQSTCPRANTATHRPAATASSSCQLRNPWERA